MKRATTPATAASRCTCAPFAIIESNSVDLDIEVGFRQGETIWTESSHKFDLATLEAMAARARFSVAAVWVDGDWPFAESLWIAQ